MLKQPTPETDPDLMTIHFLLPEGVAGYLSNFSPHGVCLDGVEWPTVEHCFQAMKFANDPQLQEQIRRADSACAAKRIAWEHAAIRSDWRQVREQVMLRALRAKFSQHPDLGEKLLATGARQLVEVNPRDGYWGNGGDGSGQNRTGELLMLVREELRRGLREQDGSS